MAKEYDHQDDRDADRRRLEAERLKRLQEAEKEQPKKEDRQR